jgi:hypothetical protein
MNLNQRLDAIARSLPAKSDIDLSKLTTEQLRYVADGQPIPLDLLTPEAVEALNLDSPPTPLIDLVKTKEVIK